MDKDISDAFRGAMKGLFEGIFGGGVTMFLDVIKDDDKQNFNMIIKGIFLLFMIVLLFIIVGVIGWMLHD